MAQTSLSSQVRKYHVVVLFLQEIELSFILVLKFLDCFGRNRSQFRQVRGNS